jgi:hypothetical protein
MTIPNTVEAHLEELSSAKYFIQEYSRFRDIMCSTKHSFKNKRIAFGAMFMLWMNLPKEDHERLTGTWNSLSDEFMRRAGLTGELETYMRDGN